MGAVFDTCTGKKAKEVAIICTSECDFAGTPTGTWIAQTAIPYYLFKSAGCKVVLVSIRGGEIPVDDASRRTESFTERAMLFDSDPVAQQQMQQSISIETVRDNIFDAIYLSGGAGACVDFPDNKALIDFIELHYRSRKVIAADSHGSVALVNCMKPNGEPLVAGLKVTGLSNDELAEWKLLQKCEQHSYLVENRFAAVGGYYHKAEQPWEPNVCVSGKLVTGQNPSSTEHTAAKVISLIEPDTFNPTDCL